MTYELKDWKDISNIREWWEWHQTVLMDTFFVSRFLSARLDWGNPLNHKTVIQVDTYYNGDAKTKLDSQSIAEHIKFTGGFRITQRRVAPDTCLEKLVLTLGGGTCAKILASSFCILSFPLIQSLRRIDKFKPFFDNCYGMV